MAFRILVITEGKRTIGLGHLSRCLALVQAFQVVRKDCTVKFIVNGDRIAGEFLRKNQMGYQLTDWLRQKQRLFKLCEQVDIVIIDTYLAKEDFFEEVDKAKRSEALVIVIDDSNRIHYQADVIVNPFIYGGRLPYREDSQIFLAGRKFVIVRKEFWNVPFKKIKREVKDVLIIFGGTDQSLRIKKVVDCILKWNPFLRIHIVSPHSLSSLRKLNGVIFYQNLPGHKIKDLMLRADVCLTGGGQTTNELARCGVPSIGIGFAENQRLSLEGWKDWGFMKDYLWAHDPHLADKLPLIFGRIWAYEKRLILSKRGRSLIDGQGPLRIAKSVIALKRESLKLRKVKKEDCGFLFRWRNHPEVRRYSLNHNRIKYAEHQQWFFRVIRDPNIKIFIAYHGKERIGVIRFHRGPSKSIINVNLNPRFIGKGLGPGIIRDGTRRYIQENRVKKPIIAETLKSNVRSQRAFEKAGFHLCRTNGESSGVVRYEYCQAP